MPRWLLALGGVALVAGHALVLRSAASHLAWSGAVASGVVALIVVKHLGLAAALYRRLRRRHGG